MIKSGQTENAFGMIMIDNPQAESWGRRWRLERRQGGSSFLVELRPSFAPWPPHLTCTPGPSKASWGHPGLSWSWWWWWGWWRRGRGSSQRGSGLRRLPSHPHRPHQQHHLGQMHKLCGGKLDDSNMNSWESESDNSLFAATVTRKSESGI